MAKTKAERATYQRAYRARNKEKSAQYQKDYIKRKKLTSRGEVVPDLQREPVKRVFTRSDLQVLPPAKFAEVVRKMSTDKARLAL